MNRLISPFFLLVVILSLLVGVDLRAAAPTFDGANQLYDQGNFAGAKAAYEQLAAAGQRSANLYYNLGNAEYRLGEHGKAILEYERALALQPDHPEAQANLKLAREKSGARLLVPSWVDRAILPWPSESYVIAVAVAGWLAIFSLAGMWLWRRGDSLALWVALVFASAVALYAGLGVWHDRQERALGIVTVRETVARLSPADRAGVAETLPAGSRVRVLSERGEWIYCELPSGTRGWLAAGTMEKVRAPNS